MTDPNLLALRSELLRRLEDGDEQIQVAKKEGVDTTRWEQYWMTLLREYESICASIIGTGIKEEDATQENDPRS